MMALEDPLDPSRDSCPRDPCPDDMRTALELWCNIIFTAELMFKVFAYGFVIGQGTYLRGGWNILDFIIGARNWVPRLPPAALLTRACVPPAVVTAWLPYVMAGGAATNALRVLRVLRPLRTISRFQGLKYLVITIFMAAPQLQLLVIVVALFFITFGICGIQLWKGKFLQRCEEPGISPGQCPAWDSASNGYRNDTFELCPCAYGMFGCEGKFCDVLSDDMNPFGQCPEGLTCGEAYDNPYFGFVSFDNIVATWIIVLQCVSTNNWQASMHITQATTGNVSMVYYYACVLLGSYFLMNLFVAVLKEKFAISTSVMAMSATLFDDVDATGDGLLDKEEIQLVFNSKGVVLSQDELDQVFGEM
jgi:hypothetical protein